MEVDSIMIECLRHINRNLIGIRESLDRLNENKRVIIEEETDAFGNVAK